jgi:thioredoxin-like negative regulator of GroEL
MIVGLAAMLVASPVLAQGEGVAGAEALYQEGRQLMDAGNFADACPKLEESQRLDPGTGTLWHLARCYEKLGRHASAWAKYHEVAAQAKKQEEPAKVAAALKRAGALEPKLRRLVIEVPADSRIQGLRIVRNGIEVGPGAWGAKLPVDLGAH